METPKCSSHETRDRTEVYRNKLQQQLTNCNKHVQLTEPLTHSKSKHYSGSSQFNNEPKKYTHTHTHTLLQQLTVLFQLYDISDLHHR